MLWHKTQGGVRSECEPGQVGWGVHMHTHTLHTALTISPEAQCRGHDWGPALLKPLCSSLELQETENPTCKPRLPGHYKYVFAKVIEWTKSLQSCPTLWDPMDCSPPGSSVHGILQTRILEWVAMSSPGDIPNPGIEPTFSMLQEDSLPLVPPGKPKIGE